MKFNHKNFSTNPYQKKVEKPWGYEIIYTKDDAPATGKILHVLAGKRLSLQYHDHKTETLCLFSGKAMITLSNKNGQVVEIPMKRLMGYHVVAGQTHRVRAITDIDILEASEPEKGNTFRLQDDVGRPTETEKMRRLKNRGWNKK